MVSPFSPCTVPLNAFQPLLSDEGREIRQEKKGKEELKRRKGTGLRFPGIMVRRRNTRAKKRNKEGDEGKRRKKRGCKELIYTEHFATICLFSTISVHFHNPTKWVLWYHKDRSPFCDSCPFPKNFWAANIFLHPTE